MKAFLIKRLLRKEKAGKFVFSILLKAIYGRLSATLKVLIISSQIRNVSTLITQMQTTAHNFKFESKTENCLSISLLVYDFQSETSGCKLNIVQSKQGGYKCEK